MADVCADDDYGDCSEPTGPYWVPRERPRQTWEGLRPVLVYDNRPNAIGSTAFPQHAELVDRIGGGR